MATVVLAMEEVVVSAAGGIGWQEVGFLALGFLNFYMSNFLIFCFFSFCSGAGAGGLVGSKFGLSPSKSGMHERVLSFTFLLLPSSAIFLSCILMASLILSLSFCLAPSQSTSEDQSECIDGKISAGEGLEIALTLYGGLCMCGLDVDSVLDVLSRLEWVGVCRPVGAEAGRAAVVVVVVVAVCADAAVDGMEHPVFLYFLLCPYLLSITGVKGLESLSSQLFLFSSS